MALRNTSPLIIILILGLAFFPGCYDSEDVDQRMIVSPIGIDSGPDNKMLVSFRMPLVNPAGVTGGNTAGAIENDFIVRSALAKGIYPALLDIQSRDEHRVFVGQCRAIIFGESYAKKGIKPACDFFNRIPTFPPNSYVVIARPSAEQIQSIKWREPEQHDQSIRYFFSNHVNQIFAIERWKLFQKVCDPLQDPVAPLVTPSDANETMKLLGLAVFQGHRMVGELNNEEMALLGLYMHINKENRITIPLSGPVSTTFRVVTGKKRLKVFYYRGQPRFKVELKLNAFLGEHGGYEPPLTIHDVHQLEVYCARYLQRSYLALFRKLQSLESDPLNLGNNYRVQQPQHFQLQSWPEEYRRAEFQVSVKVFIEKLGVLR